MHQSRSLRPASRSFPTSAYSMSGIPVVISGGADSLLLHPLNLGCQSDPAAIHHIMLIGACRGFVGCEENRELRDFLGHELPLEALTPHQLFHGFGRQPIIELALRHDPAW